MAIHSVFSPYAHNGRVEQNDLNIRKRYELDFQNKHAIADTVALRRSFDYFPKLRIATLF